MIRSVDFLSLTDAERINDRPDLVVISIGEGAAMPARLRVPGNRVLRILFHDIDPAAEWYMEGLEVFDSEHAGEIIDWIRKWHANPSPLMSSAIARAADRARPPWPSGSQSRRAAHSHAAVKPVRQISTCFGSCGRESDTRIFGVP